MMKYMKLWASWRRQPGFTIVELLIVIVVISILVAVTVVAFNGVQSRARQSKVQSDMANMLRLIEAYNVENGYYPLTTTQGASLNPNWGDETARTDSNCAVGTQDADWIPGLSATLPQSDDIIGAAGLRGCYVYASNGSIYVLSAWNMVSAAQTSTMYRRIGFREVDAGHPNQFYICNHSIIGGDDGGYVIGNDYYKHSLTISNITDCDETPPPGA